MAKKLNSMPDYTAHLPKHPHDVSQAFTFTACPGMLLPTYYDMLHLGDELHFSASEFVRLNPLEQQPLGEIDVHLDYFFVPLTVMYLPSSSLFYMTDDLVSSVFADGALNTDEFPAYNFQQSYESMANAGGSWSQRSPFCSFVSGTNSYLPVSSFDCFGKSIYRLLDMLDMSPDLLLDSIDKNTVDIPSFTPWFALAYQAIYQLYFRNDDREPKNYHYNIDKYATDGSFYEVLDGSDKSILQINYANRPKDYFNSVKWSPIASSISLLSGSAIQSVYQDVNTWINNSNSLPSKNDRVVTPDINGLTTQVRNSASGLSTGAVRQMFMVEKLLRVVGRAEKNYESQFLAHYGIKIPHDVMHNITHIGHDLITIRPEAVISQANTWNEENESGSALGEIGGKGSGMLSGRKHSFKAPFHGVFMAICHIVPRKRYVLGLNKLHQLNTVADFWQPEFDQKGMQPLFTYECSLNSEYNSTMNGRLGWQFAYEQFKRKADRVSRAFMPTKWDTHTVNSYSPWVMAQLPFSLSQNDGSILTPYANGLTAYNLLISPNDLNINMQVPHDTGWPNGVLGSVHMPWLLYQTDPFICDFYMYCKKVNRMSEYGEPEL